MCDLPVRKSTRLKNFDYSQVGYYFVTICTQNRIDRFGKISVGQGLCSCRLTDIGNIIETELMALEKRFDSLHIGKYAVMPNHIHAIIGLDKRREQSPRPTTLSGVICAYKSITAKMFNIINNSSGRVLWQTGFHDHIIRNEKEYQEIWQYDRRKSNEMAGRLLF